MTALTTVRTFKITNGTETREVAILHCQERGYLLHEVADIFCNNLQKLADDSDTSVMDVIRDSGFEIAE